MNEKDNSIKDENLLNILNSPENLIELENNPNYLFL